MPRESAAALRREYESVKRLYHRAGRAAAGKPARSRAQRDYAVVRAEYHRLGRLLGRLTGKRSRS